MAKTGTFDPLNPSVNPGDSVLLPNSKLPEYLDAALKALAPDRKARDSFIQLRVSSISPLIRWGHKK